MKLKRFSLRNRIFIAMILLVVIASILIALIAVYQYNEQTKDYHKARLERKEMAIKKSIDIELQRRTTFPVEEAYLAYIFKERIYDIAEINQMDILLFNLAGELQISSSPEFSKKTKDYNISDHVLKELAENQDHRVVIEHVAKGEHPYKSSYTYIYDKKFKPIGILHLHYLQDNSFQQMELKEFLSRLAMVYIFMLIIAIIIAYLVSQYITRSIKTVSEKMQQTTLTKTNEKIILEDASLEIYNLVNAYNNMVDQLEASALRLAKSEREQAWREMAKQVAHEIKNPLTPMRLTVQSFKQRFDPTDSNIKEKVNEFSQTLIQQIDTMTAIASAFSNFAEMPKQNNEALNIVEVVKRATNIFYEDYIHYFYEEPEIIVNLDKNHVIRIVTNLVKNAVQSVENKPNKKIEVKVFQQSENVILSVADNGIGIKETDKTKIFEPKFTTKSSGMGLGLGMVKNLVEAYGGSISVISEVGKGSVFTVRFPK